MSKMKQFIPDEDMHDYDFYDGVDDRDYEEDYDMGYSESVQSFNDRLDFTRELYEAGEIDEIQLAEMRAGA